MGDNNYERPSTETLTAARSSSSSFSARVARPNSSLNSCVQIRTRIELGFFYIPCSQSHYLSHIHSHSLSLSRALLLSRSLTSNYHNQMNCISYRLKCITEKQSGAGDVVQHKQWFIGRLVNEKSQIFHSKQLQIERALIEMSINGALIELPANLVETPNKIWKRKSYPFEALIYALCQKRTALSSLASTWFRLKQQYRLLANDTWPMQINRKLKAR